MLCVCVCACEEVIFEYYVVSVCALRGNILCFSLLSVHEGVKSMFSSACVCACMCVLSQEDMRRGCSPTYLHTWIYYTLPMPSDYMCECATKPLHFLCEQKRNIFSVYDCTGIYAHRRQRLACCK